MGPQIIAGFIVMASQQPSRVSAAALMNRSVSTLLRVYASGALEAQSVSVHS